MAWIGEHRERLQIASRAEAIRQVPSLPAPALKPKEAAPITERQSEEAPNQTIPKITYVTEPPPIMQFISGSENAFQPVEVLPYEPVDIPSKPLVSIPRLQPRTVILGYKTIKDAQAVTEDEALAFWIERQVTRKGIKKE